MPQPVVPDAITDLADERARARADRDWARADELRRTIEAAGWRIEDDGTAYRLAPASAPDVEVEGRRFYGSPASVPSVLGEPPTCRATIVVDAGRYPDIAGTLASVAAAGLVGAQVVVVEPLRAAEPGDGVAAPVERPEAEVVGTATRFSAAGAFQAALRRARGELVIVLSPDLDAEGDFLAPLEAALRDPTVAIVGDAGLLSTDLRRFDRAPSGDVAAVGSGCYAFRRADAIAVGPIDERLNRAEGTALWLSLALRDGGPDVPPRRALAIQLPLRLSPAPARAAAMDAGSGRDEDRLARRDRYRVADRFAGRPWLAVSGEPARGAPQEGAEGHHESDDGHEREDARES